MDIKSALLATKPRVEPVAIDAALYAGPPMFVRVMTGAERAAWANEVFGEDGAKRDPAVSEKMIVRSLCDSDGSRVFKDDEWKAVAEMPSDLITAIDKAAAKINRLTKAELADVEKNSIGT